MNFSGHMFNNIFDLFLNMERLYEELEENFASSWIFHLL